MFFKKTFIGEIVKKAIVVNKHSTKIIVFPEVDETIIKACSIIIKKGIAKPIILGDETKIRGILHKLKIKNFTQENIYDYLSSEHKTDLEDFIKYYTEIRTADKKTITAIDATAKMTMPHYYGGMMVHKGLADGMISGINSETKPYYPAFEIIKTKEGVGKASGIFIMMDKRGHNIFFFADCALNINPDSELLANIALTSADTAINFGIKPKIAMLSFSTRGSAKHEMVDKVKKATEIVKQKNSELVIDGEIQLDAAIVPLISKKKCPDSMLEGNANVLVFPDLNSGNIGYKLVQRLGGYKAIGPIIQGLNKPVNDLSRGASVEDIVELTAITVVQTL